MPGKPTAEYLILVTAGKAGEPKEIAMQALVDSHLFVKKMEAKELLRSAYIHKFNKDMPVKSLDEDTEAYLKNGKVPPYLVDFMIDTYGCH